MCPGYCLRAVTLRVLLGLNRCWIARGSRDLDRVLSIASPLGLYAEEFATAGGRHLGTSPRPSRPSR
jgi:hypothetical protein